MITDELIARFLDDPTSTHALYKKAVEVAEQVQVHTKQVVPVDLLTLERPNEDPRVLKYREDIYECPTFRAANKVINGVGKVWRAQGLSIQIPEDTRPLVRKGMGFDQYLTKDFPEWDSFENYLAGFLGEYSINDPNGLIVYYPRHLETRQEIRNGVDYLEPFPFVFASSEVLDYVEGEHAVILKKNDKSPVTVGEETKKEGNVFLFVDRFRLVVWEQFGKKEANTYRERFVPIVHGFGKLPAHQLASSRVLEAITGYKLYASVLSACLSDWREAIRRYSDVQACLIDHVAPEKWMLMTVPCNKCDGKTGLVSEAPCGTCRGTGSMEAYSPYKVHLVAPVSKGLNEGVAMPSGAPGGYIEKDIEAVKFLNEVAQAKVVDGLDAIGLAILEETPLNQSGTAKEIDRSEADTFFYNIARHIVDNILRPGIYFMQEWRYPMLSTQERTDYYNSVQIKVPTTFNLINPAYYQERAAQARADKESPMLIAQAELDHALNQYGENSLTFLTLKAALELDPMPGLTAAEKAEAKLNDSRLEDAYYVSTSLQSLITEAYKERPDFFTLEYKEQKAIIYGLVPKASNPLMTVAA